MFGKKYKDANNDIKIDENLKTTTINKMQNINSKNYNLSFRKVGLILVAITLVISSTLFFNNKKTESYAIGTPEYPTKIKFDDFDEEVKEEKTLMKNLLKTLRIFPLIHLP